MFDEGAEKPEAAADGSQEEVTSPTSLMVPQNTGRPVSCNSRVTFHQDPVTEAEVEAREPPSLQSRRIFKPKSILVPRSQPVLPLGPSITKLTTGHMMERASHAPQSAPNRNNSNQVLSQSQSWSFDPAELLGVQQQSASKAYITLTSSIGVGVRGTSIRSARQTSAGVSGGDAVPARPRRFARTFSRAASARRPTPAAGDQPLSVGNNLTAVTQPRSAGVTPVRSRSASHQAMVRRQEAMMRRAPVTPQRTVPSIPSSGEAKERLGEVGGQFSFEHDSHARKSEMGPRRYMQRGR